MVYIFLASGFEEIEALTQIDLLRRAEIGVTSVGVSGKFVKGSHGINVECDKTIDEVSLSDAEMLILPGGMPGVTNLYNCKKVTEAVLSAAGKGVYIAAICAAPMILGKLNLSDKRSMICFPGFEEELLGAVISEKPVVTDGNIITAKAAGAAIEFAAEIIAVLKGKDVSDRIIKSIYYDK